MTRILIVALVAFVLFCADAIAQSSILSPSPMQRFEDNDSHACSGCLVYTFAAGTTTKLSTYTDSTGATPNLNPIVLNTRGEASIWLRPGTGYKFVLSPSTDKQPPSNPMPTSPYWTVDNINTTAGGGGGCALPNPLVADGACFLSQAGAATAKQIADWAFCNDCTLDVSYDAIRGVVTSPQGTTVDLTNAVAGYVLNQNVSGAAFPVDVVLMGFGISAVDGAKTWGLNTVLTDNKGQSAQTLGARFVLNEFDFNITSALTQVTGLQFAGSSFHQPALANGLVFFPLDPTGLVAKWTNVITSTDGAAINFATVGAAQPTGVNIASQTIAMNYKDSGGNEQNATLTALNGLSVGGTADANLSLQPPLNGSNLASLYLPSNNGVLINNHAVLSADGVATETICSDAYWSTCNIGNVTDNVNLFGTVVTPNTPTGTPAASLCLDSGNHVIKKTTSGPCI